MMCGRNSALGSRFNQPDICEECSQTAAAFVREDKKCVLPPSRRRQA